ncbi:MAG: type II secretion system protein GspG [Planctomycetaceae bacterium]|nr:type II secretion system protein GspG [Planctomycetaceae bacterium]
MKTICNRNIVKLPTQNKRSAFTLLELLIVLGILGVIAAMVVPNLLGSQKKANILATESSIHGLEQALKLHAVENKGVYPTGGVEIIDVLMSKTDEDGTAVDPLLESKPLDAWGQPLMYEYPNSKAETTKPAIWSYGPDQTDDQGEGDDINNWTIEE